MGAGSAFVAAKLLPSAGNAIAAGVASGALGGIFGGQAGIATTAFIDEAYSSDGFQFSEGIRQAQASGLGSRSQMGVDAAIGGLSGGVGIAVGRIIQPKLVDMKLRTGYHHSTRKIPTMGGERPHVYLYEPSPSQSLVGNGITVGVDVSLDTLLGRGGTTAGCQLANCPQ